MVQRHIIYQVEFVSSDGIRIEWDGDVWRVQNSRQLGEAVKTLATDLIARCQEVSLVVPEEVIGKHVLEDKAIFIAKRLKLRITHKRKKFFDV